MVLARRTAQLYGFNDDDAYSHGYVTVTYVLKAYKPECGELETYAIKSLQNAFSRLRKNRRNEVRVVSLNDCEEIEGRRSPDVTEHIDALPLDYVEFARCKYVEGMTLPEIAERLRISLKEAQSKNRFVLRHLRKSNADDH